MEIISQREIENDYSLKNVLGKKVIAENGEVLGRVKDVAFDADRILGIYIWGIFHRRKTLIDKQYIEDISKDSVLLKINPITTILGKQVYDMNGKRIGKIVEIFRSTRSNQFERLTVKKNLFTPSRTIYSSEVETIGKNVILNKVIV